MLRVLSSDARSPPQTSRCHIARRPQTCTFATDSRLHCHWQRPFPLSFPSLSLSLAVPFLSFFFPLVAHLSLHRLPCRSTRSMELDSLTPPRVHVTSLALEHIRQRHPNKKNTPAQPSRLTIEHAHPGGGGCTHLPAPSWDPGPPRLRRAWGHSPPSSVRAELHSRCVRNAQAPHCVRKQLPIRGGKPPRANPPRHSTPAPRISAMSGQTQLTFASPPVRRVGQSPKEGPLLPGTTVPLPPPKSLDGPAKHARLVCQARCGRVTDDGQITAPARNGTSCLFLSFAGEGSLESRCCGGSTGLAGGDRCKPQTTNGVPVPCGVVVMIRTEKTVLVLFLFCRQRESR